MTAEKSPPPTLTRADFDSDAEYKEYLAIEEGDIVDVESPSTDRKAYWKAIAENTISGQRERITISVPKRNLSRLKAKALEEGLPYQTLINAIIQRYLTTN